MERVPKAASTSLMVGKSFCRWREGATCRNSTVNSGSHLETGPQQSDQCPHDGFRYSLSSVLGSVCFHFLRPVLRIVAASVKAAVRSSCS